jgi:4-methyl-5(b-hydroxyethyl)-thiazole monophosphate biosynthesis
MKSPKVVVPFAEGFEEIEALTIVDVLRRAGITVDMVGIVGSMVTGGHGVRITMDKKLPQIQAEDYNGIILPGGNPGYVNLGRSSVLLELVKKMNGQGKMVAAICASPSVLAKAGVLEGKRATIFPGMEKEIPYPRGDKVVVDGNVITSQGPGTAMEFALKIVEKLVGKEMSNSMKRNLIA